MAEAVDLSKLKEKAAEPDSPEALLARALRNLGERLAGLEAEMKDLDTNVAHIAGALEAIIETAMAKADGAAPRTPIH